MANIFKIILLYIVGMLCIPTIYANDSEICKVHIYLTDKVNFEYLYINEGERFIYEDTIGLDSNVIIYRCSEPEKFFIIINNDPTHLIPIFIHPGEFSIYVNLHNYSYYFKNSELNSLNKILVGQEDSLRRVTNTLSSFEFFKLAMNNININQDSLKIVMQNFNLTRAKMNYNYFRKHPKSYLALTFVWIQLHPNNQYNTKNKLLFSKNKLAKIFKHLPSNYKNYSQYKECVKLFNPVKINNNKNSINKPLWNEK